MNPIYKILSAPFRALKAFSFNGLNTPSDGGILGSLLPRTRFNYASEVRTTLNAPVMACVNWICRNFPEAPIVVRKRDNEGIWSIDFRHAMSKLLRAPNPFYSGALLMMAVLAEFVAGGNAYIWKIRSSSGRVVQLWWIPAQLITPRWPLQAGAVTSDTYISHYDYSPGGRLISIAPADIIHLRQGLDSANTRLGLSPLRAVLREIFTDDEAANFTASLLRNLGIPGVVLSPKDGMVSVTPESAQTIKDKFNENFGGDNRGSVMVMMGPTDVEVLSFSPEQMDLKGIRRVPEERISAVLGIPAIVAGLGAGLDRSTFANMKEAREMAYENGIIPLQRIIGSELTLQLLTDFEEIGDEQAEVAFDLREVRVLQEDENALAKRHAELVLGGIEKRSEARAAMGLPFETSDEVYLIPINVQEVGPGADADPDPETREHPILAGRGKVKDYPGLGSDGAE